MIERDYILRILQEFFDAIAKVVRRDADGREPDTAQMQERFEEMYVQFFRRPARHFYEREKALIIDDLEQEGRSEGDLQARVQMLAELLYHDGMIKRTIPERCLLLEK